MFTNNLDEVGESSISNSKVNQSIDDAVSLGEDDIVVSTKGKLFMCMMMMLRVLTYLMVMVHLLEPGRN